MTNSSHEPIDYTALCRKLDANLPDNWEVYTLALLPRKEAKFTHIEIKGSVTLPLKRGPRKGEKHWTKLHDRTFIVALSEVSRIYKEGYDA